RYSSFACLKASGTLWSAKGPRIVRSHLFRWFTPGRDARGVAARPKFRAALERAGRRSWSQRVARKAVAASSPLPLQYFEWPDPAMEGRPWRPKLVSRAGWLLFSLLTWSATRA